MICITNLQGDVVELLNESGNEVGSYEYTAYGNVSITMGHPVVLLNPLLYRGYISDLGVRNIYVRLPASKFFLSFYHKLSHSYHYADKSKVFYRKGKINYVK